MRYCFALAIVAATVPLVVHAADEPSVRARVNVVLDQNAAADPINGRLYLFLSQRGGEPMRGPDWFRPEPFFRLDVEDFRPGETRDHRRSRGRFPRGAEQAAGRQIPGTGDSRS
ncbi:MAG: hypothetical protein WD894_11045 [Pirellulales bacterium]